METVDIDVHTMGNQKVTVIYNFFILFINNYLGTCKVNPLQI